MVLMRAVERKGSCGLWIHGAHAGCGEKGLMSRRRVAEGGERKSGHATPLAHGVSTRGVY